MTNLSTNKSENPNRLRYILHLWNCAGQWRASLENLETDKRFGFENLEQLFAYLMDLIEGNLKAQQKAEEKESDGSNQELRVVNANPQTRSKLY